MAAYQCCIPLLLASASPRRKALLSRVGLEPVAIISPDIDETLHEDELPKQAVLRLAAAKARAAQSAPEFAGHKGAAILAADTMVACGRSVLDKAYSAEDVRRFLARLSGRRHSVHGGIAVLLPDGQTMRTRHVETKVKFKRLSESEINAYVQSCEGEGKAGGYSVQGMGEMFISFLGGSFSNVVGLSLYDTINLLKGSGVITEIAHK